MTTSTNICGLLNLTVRCNQNCLFCCDGDVKDSGYHLSFEEACAKVAEIAAQGADSITFIGGEPLVQKYLPELIAFARTNGLRVGLTTNGSLLTKKRLHALLAAGLTSLEISIHTFKPALADEISQRSRTAEKQRRALELLKDLPDRPGVSINYVVFDRNFRHLPDFTRTVIAKYSFINELFINFLDPIGFPARDPSLLPTYTEVRPFLHEALDLAHQAGLSFTVDSVPGCILGRYFLFLRATREKLRGIRYAKQTLRIQESNPDPDQSQYYRVNACHICPVNGLCPGVNFRYLGIKGEEEFQPFPADLLARSEIYLPPEVSRSIKNDLAAAARSPHPLLRPRTLLLTTRCNNRCGWCSCRAEGHIEPSPGNLAASLAKEMEHPEPLRLTGGEPALHPQFFPLLKQLGKNGRKVGFVTNGRIFSYRKWAQRAGQLASFVQLRLPAPFNTISSQTGDPDAESQTRTGFESLRRNRSLYMSAEVSVPKGTEELLQATLDELKEAGVFEVKVVREK